MVSLQPISATSAYPLLPSQVVSICNLQRLVLCWFHAPGLQLDNKVSQSTDQPHGTVCHQHYSHRTCRRAPSSGHWRRTCSRPPGATETSSRFWRQISISRLTYLLILAHLHHYFNLHTYCVSKHASISYFCLFSVFLFLFRWNISFLLSSIKFPHFHGQSLKRGSTD